MFRERKARMHDAEEGLSVKGGLDWGGQRGIVFFAMEGSSFPAGGWRPALPLRISRGRKSGECFRSHEKRHPDTMLRLSESIASAYH